MPLPVPVSPSADRNLLFGVLALQADLIDVRQFAEACTAWSARKDTPLAEMLVERGWLTLADRSDIERVLDRKLKRHAGDAKASLAEITTDLVRRSLAGLTDPDVQQSLEPSTAATLGHVLLSTSDHLPESRERYTLSRLHASGGIGRVWLARDAALGRDVALKELLPERAAQPALWARFLQEAQITGQLEHPGVVPIYEVGRRPDDQAPFYTMRFVRGRTLAEAVAAHHRRRALGAAGSLELRGLLTAFVGVCNAVAYAHSRGVIHRDLKPQNVVLGDYGEAIVLDWGLARLIDAADVGDDSAPPPINAGFNVVATMQGQALGTPAYMAPEQAEGRVDLLGPRTDVYGLGAILYEILTGRQPFSGDDTVDVLRRVVHEEPLPPSSLTETVPAALEAVCLKAIVKNPAARYESAKALAGDVERWMADEPVSSWREPVRVRAGRWVRKHRTGVATVVAALIVAVVGLLTVAAVQAESKRQLASKNDELEQSNRSLAQARDRAESRLDLAAAAIDRFRTTVDDNLEVKEKPENKPLRKTLLQAPLAFYEKLRDDLLAADDSDARARERLARSFERLGLLNAEIGSQADALKAYQESTALFESLVKQAPESTRGALQMGLAKALNDLGLLQSESSQQAEAARTSLDKAQSILETALKNGTTDEDSRLLLVRVLDNLSSLDTQQGKVESALERLRRSLALIEESRRSGSNPLATGVLLAETHLRIARGLKDRKGRLDEALSEVQAAVQSAQPLARANVDNVPASLALCSGFSLTGEIHQQMGDTATSLECYRQGLDAAESILRSRPSDIRCRLKRINCIRMVASTQNALGNHAEALETLRTAKAGVEELVRDNPTNKTFKKDLADLWGHIAVTQFSLGQTTEALAAIEAGAVFLEELVRYNPGELSLSRNLAGSYYNLGMLNLELGRSDVALSYYQKSLTLRERLVHDHPENPKFPFDLATTLGNIGVVHTYKGRFTEAHDCFERAVRILQDLSRADSKNVETETYLARARMNLGSTLNSLERAEEGLAVLRAALETFARIAAAQPKVVQNQFDLASCQLIFAEVLVDAGRSEEAVPEFDKANAIFERLLAATPDNSEIPGSFIAGLLGRGKTHQATGNLAGAAQFYRRALALAEKQPSAAPEMLYKTARIHARLASLAGAVASGVTADEGKRQAELAVKSLAQSLPGRAISAAKLQATTDLESLRQREDFQKLLREIEAKGPAK